MPDDFRMTVEDKEGDLPSHDQASGFYAKYEPKEVLGKGVSSTVRRCVEKVSGKDFAVKIIDISGEKGEADLVEQTKKETTMEINILLMCKDHPNIIALHDTYETPTFIFLVFELCKKGELFDYLTEVVTLSEKRTRSIMRQLIEAVEFIHSKNIVHRDLKPENILLDDNLNIKLSDFGFATHVAPGEELTDLCGTPAYLAPEVLAVSMYENVPGYGKEVDMWACGVIMYTLLVGAPPFWHRKQMYMIRSIMQGSYRFGSPEWDDISSTAKDLISNFLKVDPRQRLTAKEALLHPFFQREDVEYARFKIRRYNNRMTSPRDVMSSHYGTMVVRKKFDAKRKFRVGILSVRFFLRLRHFYHHPPPISVETVTHNPYVVKNIRKVIDGCAFRIYGHWVKKGDNQNRAALFEHLLKVDWRSEDKS